MSTTTDSEGRDRAGTRSRPARGTPAGRRGAAGTGTARSTGAPARTRPAERTRPPAGQPRRASGAGRRPAPRAPRLPFVMLILALLGGALVSLLALQTVLIEDAFTRSQLQAENRKLSHKEERLREAVAREQAPDRIAEDARELGMEPGGAPLTLNPKTGEVSGDDRGGTGLPGTDEQARAGAE